MWRFSEQHPVLWSYLERLSAVVWASLAFWIVLFPVVTAPAALTALFASVAPLVRGEREEWFVLYWQTLKRTFFTSLGLALLNLVVGLILWVDIAWLWWLGHPLAKAGAFLLGSVAILALLVNLYAWPLLAYSPQRLRPLLKRSFLLSGAHPLAALGGWLLGLAGIIALFLLPPFFRFLLPLAGPGLWVTAWSFGAWRAMSKYVDPEPTLDEPLQGSNTDTGESGV